MTAHRWRELARKTRNPSLRHDWWRRLHAGDRCLLGKIEKVVVNRIWHGQRPCNEIDYDLLFTVELVDGRVVDGAQVWYDTSFLPGTRNGMVDEPPGPGDPLYREGYGFPLVTIQDEADSG